MPDYTVLKKFPIEFDEMVEDLNLKNFLIKKLVNFHQGKKIEYL